MARAYSIIRRRPGVVDIIFPQQAGKTSYKFQWAANWDAGAWTDLITCTNHGYSDPAVVGDNVVYNNQGAVRVTFNPTTFSITDTSVFWLRMIPYVGGAPGTPTPPLMILPDQMLHGTGVVVVSGTAVQGAALANSVEIHLPGRMENFRIHNESTTIPLAVAFDAGGAEYTVTPNSPIPQFIMEYPAQDSLWVRGVGGTAAFSMSCTRSFPR